MRKSIVNARRERSSASREGKTYDSPRDNLDMVNSCRNDKKENTIRKNSTPIQLKCASGCNA